MDHDVKEEIIFYLKSVENVSDQVAKQIYTKMEQYPEILDEFYYYIKNRSYPSEPVNVMGYTAQLLTETTYLHPVGAYNYLIYLLRKPTEAIENLEKGLPQK